jgi:hypothetical protein
MTILSCSSLPSANPPASSSIKANPTKSNQLNYCLAAALPLSIA